jgi:2-oxoglutarate ferredoxin oxidoreductase subunit gamma
MRRNIRFAGSGGQGVILASVLLAKAYGIEKGYNISQTQSYGPEARGGACKAELVISDREIDYMKVDRADVFVALNQVGYDRYIGETTSNAVVLINETLVDATDDRVFLSPTDDSTPLTQGRTLHRIPATEIAETRGAPMTENLVMIGALTVLLRDMDNKAMRKVVEGSFQGEAGENNLAAFDEGYRYAQKSEIRDTALKDKTRSRIMIFVTTQKTCARLIRFGRELIPEASGELSIIHIADRRFSTLNEKAEEALDYLYEYALEYGANLMVIRSEDVPGTMANLVLRNRMDTVVLGESGKTEAGDGLIGDLRERIGEHADVIVLPPDFQS